MSSKHRRRSPSLSSQPSDISERSPSPRENTSHHNGTRSRSRNFDDDRSDCDTQRKQRRSRRDSQERETASTSRRHDDRRFNDTKNRKKDPYNERDQGDRRRSRRDSYEDGTDRKRDKKQSKGADRGDRNGRGDRKGRDEEKYTEKRDKPKKKDNGQGATSGKDRRSGRRSRSASRERRSDGYDSEREAERRQKSRLVADELESLRRRQNSRGRDDAEEDTLGQRSKHRKTDKEARNDGDEVDARTSTGTAKLGREGDDRKSKDAKNRSRPKDDSEPGTSGWENTRSRPGGLKDPQMDATSRTAEDPPEEEDRLKLQGGELNRAYSSRSALSVNVETTLNAKDTMRTERYIMENPGLLRRATYVTAAFSILEALFGIICGGVILADTKKYFLNPDKHTDKDYKEFMVYTYIGLSCLALLSSALLIVANKKVHLDLMILYIAVQLSTGIVFIGGTGLYLFMELTKVNPADKAKTIFEDQLLATLYFSSLFFTLIVVKVINLFVVTSRFKKLTWRPTAYFTEGGLHPMRNILTGHSVSGDDHPTTPEHSRALPTNTQSEDTRERVNSEAGSHFSADDSVSTSEFNYVAHTKSRSEDQTQTVNKSLKAGTRTGQDGVNSSAPPKRPSTVVAEVHQHPDNGTLRSQVSMSFAQSAEKDLEISGYVSPVSKAFIPRANAVTGGVPPTAAPRYHIHGSVARGRTSDNEPHYENGRLHEIAEQTRPVYHRPDHRAAGERQYPSQPLSVPPVAGYRYDDQTSQNQNSPHYRERIEDVNHGTWNDRSQPQLVPAVKFRKSLPPGAVPAVGSPEEWARHHGRFSFPYGTSPTDEPRNVRLNDPEPDY